MSADHMADTRSGCVAAAARLRLGDLQQAESGTKPVCKAHLLLPVQSDESCSASDQNRAENDGQQEGRTAAARSTIFINSNSY